MIVMGELLAIVLRFDKSVRLYPKRSHKEIANTIAQKVDPCGTSAEKSIPRCRRCAGTSYLGRAKSVDQPDDAVEVG
jgi:hypothetical protein